MSTPFAPVDRFEPPVADDVLGNVFSEANSPQVRRADGITLTPPWLVQRMLDLAASRGGFDTIVDCGAGTGRFAMAAARRFPHARVIAVEAHAEVASMLRQRLRDGALADRVEVLEADFRSAALALRGRTLFIGNPPYVRHHDIAPEWKAWYRSAMAALGIGASRLAGLHAQFMLRAAASMRDGDLMLFVTAAEWLDNGYGGALRKLCAHLPQHSLRSLWLALPGEPIFADALVSSVVVEVARESAGAKTQLGLIAGRQLHPVRQLDAQALRSADRWSPLCREAPLASGSGVELGELFRITRGQVTGCNEAWVLPPHSELLRGASAALAVAAVTRATEIIEDRARSAADASRLHRVVDLPADLESLPDAQRAVAMRLIERARRLDADAGYVARHRKPWYRVAMRAPPLAFVSYMGRRPPVFRANPQSVSFINIAHGLYPRVAMPAAVLEPLLSHLNATTDLESGRVYGGGLAKFEPSDVARLRIPPRLLASDP